MHRDPDAGTADTWSATKSVRPRQLVAPPAFFTNRQRERDLLDRVLDSTEPHGRVTVVVGGGGIGKTALVLHWGHQRVADFPDGQLYVNLRGFDPTGEPLSTAVALRGFLDGLGVDPATVPAGVDAQAALYRSLLDDRRMLVVLDNALDSTQVEQLLPGRSPSTVLITSRNRLPALTLRGARTVEMSLLTKADGLALLHRHLHATTAADAEDQPVGKLVDHCKGLPLAIAIVAARAVTHPHFPLSALVDELAEDSSRLDALDLGDVQSNLQSVFSWSYRQLDRSAARMFRLLGLTSAPDIDLLATASLAGVSVPVARATLGELESAHLVEQPIPGRYRMHDLVRLYAMRTARDEDTVEERTAAQRRLVGFYLHAAFAGDQQLYPHRMAVDLDPAASGVLRHRFADTPAVFAWFKAEHACLTSAQRLAVKQGWHAQVWQLAWTLSTFHRHDARLEDDVEMWTAGLTATERLSDLVLQAYAHRNLGRAHTRAGRDESALHHLRRAVELSERSGDQEVQAFAHRALALHQELAGDYPAALHHAERARELYRSSLGTVEADADSLTLVGWCHARVGNLQESLASTEEALALHRQVGSREGEADTLQGLGFTALHLERYAEAEDYARQAHELYVEMGNRYEAPKTLDLLGQAQAAQGRADDAARAWREALTDFQAQNRDAEAQRLRDRMASS